MQVLKFYPTFAQQYTLETITMKSNISIVVLIALALSLSACLDLDDTPDVDPFFELTASGDVSQSFEGNAVFGTFENPDTGENIFLIQMNSQIPQTGSGLLLLGQFDDLPNEEIHEVIEAVLDEDGALEMEELIPRHFIGNYITNDIEVDVGEFYATGGNVDIREMNDEYVLGTFNMSAEGTSETDTLNIDLEGQFQAIKADIELQDEL